MSNRLQIIKGDTAKWACTLTGGGDLSSAQSVKVFMWDALDHTNLVIDDQVGTIVSAQADAIEVEYAPAAGEVNTEGSYQLQWEVTFTGNIVARFPSRSPLVVIIGSQIA